MDGKALSRSKVIFLLGAGFGTDISDFMISIGIHHRLTVIVLSNFLLFSSSDKACEIDLELAAI